MTLQDGCDQINIVCKDVPFDGKLHNTPVIGKDPRNTAGRIKGFTDGKGWQLLNNIDGTSLTVWRDDTPAKMTAADRTERDARIAREASEMEETRKQCRIESLKLWETVAREEIPADHPYLIAKGIRPFGIRWQSSGNLLVVPVMDINGVIHGLQFIDPTSFKKFKTGTPKTGHFFKIGTSKDNTVIIAEGYATGATIHEATGHAVAIAFDAGNLLPVSQAIRAKFPDMKIIIAADDDNHLPVNIGIVKATAAAQAVNGFLVIPSFQEVCHD
ncbi:MAG: toprim domain-containing protein [Proteobacteria bacterium]|nr:toprim domain-containing protein [Pseudomonadota bacterium]